MFSVSDAKPVLTLNGKPLNLNPLNDNEEISPEIRELLIQLEQIAQQQGATIEKGDALNLNWVSNGF